LRVIYLKNIVILGICYDEAIRCTTFIIFSDEFEDIPPDTYPIPEFKVLGISKNNKSE